MKLIDLVNARASLQKLVSQDLPIRTAYNLMLLIEDCNKHLEFYGNEIGKFDAEKDTARLEELNNLEIKRDRVSVTADDNLKLSASDVKMLLPLIEFGGLT